MLLRFGRAATLLSVVLFLQPVASPAQSDESSSGDQGWPRPLATRAGTFSIYQPQLDKWDGYRYQAHAAVALKGSADARDTFGVIWIDARSQVDKNTRSVALRDVRIAKVEFPSVADKGQAYQAALQESLRAGPTAALSPIALDRLEASLAISEAERKAETKPLKNDPPRVLFSTVPAILVSIDGSPVSKPVKGTNLQRIINTRALLLRDGSTYYLHLYDGWLQATAVEGPWTVTSHPPPALATAQQALANEVDLLDGAGPDADSPKPSLANTIVPVVHVATTPTELVVTEGDPDYVNIPETHLLYVKNTTGNVFKDLTDQSWYLLVSGRWFRASDLSGAWTFVDATRLPADFARIPDDSPKENVKASVPNTPQAQEAVIANEIPQTATVKRSGTTPTPLPVIDGAPKLEPIPDTPLQSVVNSSAPIIRADDGHYYLVQNGLWFVSDAPNGPWVVAASVPPSIYSIPPSSPLHHVTYVYVYDATAEVVYTGYTPGYFGAEIIPAGVVVYGTGYYYRPWIGTYWYAPPRTFGFGWGLAYTPWYGWSYGWGFGPVTVRFGFGGGWWYPRPWWGPYGWSAWGGAYRPVVWNSTTINVYQRYSSARVTTSAPVVPRTAAAPRLGTAYNSRTGVPAAGQRASVVSVFKPQGATHPGNASSPVGGYAEHPGGGSAPAGHPASQGAPAGQAVRPAGNHVYADKSGQIYRQTSGGGWEQHSPAGTWHTVDDPKRAQTLSRESAARNLGEARAHSFSQAQSNLGAPHAPPAGAPHAAGAAGSHGGALHGGAAPAHPTAGVAPPPRRGGGKHR